jgi:hypothetical protein
MFKNRGQIPSETELHYLDNAKNLALYGVHMHEAKVSDNNTGLKVEVISILLSQIHVRRGLNLSPNWISVYYNLKGILLLLHCLALPRWHVMTPDLLNNTEYIGIVVKFNKLQASAALIVEVAAFSLSNSK